MKFIELEVAQIEKAANMMKAIAHPMRLAILGYISEAEELTVTKIHERVNIEQSTASHHLGILKDKGVLISRREGKNTIYSLKNPNLNKLIACISDCACVDD